MKRLHAISFVLFVVGMIASSTAFFHVVEGWSILDSYFFTVVTVSTVGYGNLVPITPLGKIATTFLIFFGLAIFAVAIQQFGAFAMRKREEHTEWLIARLHLKDKAHENEHGANIDSEPRQ